ncbi:MAG: SdrD B-like domain-containing protein, partial [Verrucomicrobiota bacterium]
IGDYVWVDANGNGIQDNGEIGLAGVPVTLYQTNSDLGTLTALATTTTSPTGAYQFANQLPNSFVVGFGDVAGYTRTTPFQGGDTNLDSNAQVGSGLSEVFTLTSGQTNLTVDAGYYQPVTLGDYTWLDINGNGIQDPGEPPMAGVAITLFQSNVVTHAVSTVASATSGANGSYLFANLPPGTYQLSFNPPGGGYTHSPALQGSNTNVDSDANVTTGLTAFYTMASGMTNLTVDAGFKPNPTAVSLVSLSARQDKGQIWVTWQTYVEDGVLAFDLTRSTDGGDEQEVTPDLVWATGLDMGQTYRVQDVGVPAKTSTYHLYAYNNDGSVDEVATVNIAVANTVVGTPVQLLGIDLQGASAVLRWTGGQPPYVVEQSGSLGADADWQAVGGAQTGTQMTVPLTGPAGFFRVRSGAN